MTARGRHSSVSTVMLRSASAPGIVNLRVPGLLAYRDVAMRVVSGACKLAGSQSRIPSAGQQALFHQFVSAFGEAFNNVVLHGYAGRQPGELRLEVTWNAERIQARLSDDGLPFEPDRVPAPRLEELPDRGMGLFIIRSFVDELAYRAGPPNELVLTKYIRSVR